MHYHIYMVGWLFGLNSVPESPVYVLYISPSDIYRMAMKRGYAKLVSVRYRRSYMTNKLGTVLVGVWIYVRLAHHIATSRLYLPAVYPSISSCMPVLGELISQLIPYHCIPSPMHRYLGKTKRS